jgi:hypothetical protein
MPKVGKVFVSHASADKTFVDRLVGDLAARDIPVWYDKLDLRVGESIPGWINAGLADSQYFAIVLSKASVGSKWVQEELNAALMTQVAKGGTFILPLLIDDCTVPPLLAHRRHADFRGDYTAALTELLSIWGKDAEACAAEGKAAVHPWPDIQMPDDEFIYLHSTRFDKFFLVSCSLDWTVGHAIDYLRETLDLPWSKEVSEHGMRLRFRYSLRLDGKRMSLSTTLRQGGVQTGSVVQIGINSRYQDLYEKELKEAFSVDTVYMYTEERRLREQWLREQVAARRLLTREKLKAIADSCFAHV